MDRRISKEEEEEEAINHIFGFPTMNEFCTIDQSSTHHYYPRRLTTNPSSESAFTQNSNPPFQQTLLDHHYQAGVEDAFSRLMLSPNNNNRPIIHRLDPPTPSMNGVHMFGNPMNDSLLGNHHDFTPSPTFQQNIQTGIDYLRRLGYPEGCLAQQIPTMRADCVDVSQDLDDFGLRISNTDSVLNDPYWRMLNGGGGGGGRGGGGMVSCGCGNPLCVFDFRRQSVFELPEQFRTRSLSNTNGYRENYGGHRSRRGLSVDRPMVDLDLSRSTSNNRNLDLSRSTSNNRNRLQQYTNTSLGELRRRIVGMAQDQNGCRFLQKFVEEGKVEEIELIFSEIKDHIGKLMIDPFGNYLVQKMFEVCSQEQLTQLIHSATRIQYDLVDIALDSHGSCCVQKLLVLITTPEQISLVMSALGPGAALLTREINGQHVLQLCLKNFTNDDIKYILNVVAENCVQIATDKVGCCILQQFLERTCGDYRERIVSRITANALLLTQDPYGNYVVQYLLQLRLQRITDDILRQLKGSFVSLSLQKFSSNAVQRCLNESVEEWSVEIIRELIDSPNILMLFQDQFANYVIQTALEVSKAREHIFNALTDLIRMHYQSLRSHPFGKRVISKMNELSRRDRI